MIGGVTLASAAREIAGRQPGGGKGWQGFARESGIIAREGGAEMAQWPPSRVIGQVSNMYSWSADGL